MKKFVDLKDLGENYFEEQEGSPVLVPLDKNGATEYDADEALSLIVGWNSVPTGDSAYPVEFNGVRLIKGKFFCFFSANVSPAYEKHYTHLYRGEVCIEEFSRLVKWVEDSHEKILKDLFLEEKKRLTNLLVKRLVDLID